MHSCIKYYTLKGANAISTMPLSLPISDLFSLSYRNQSVDLFLYDGEHWLLMGYIIATENICQYSSILNFLCEFFLVSL